ncbi:MAG: hypothetical protein ACRDRU_00890 [Pseudonocardiaceae bacterium]
MEEALVARRRAAVDARLAGITVDELAGRGSRIRLQAVRNGGVGTAADVLRLGKAGLLRFSDIGESSATQLFQLVSEVNLVRDLQLFTTVGTLLGVPHLEALRQLVGLLSTVARATRWLNWLFSGRAKRSAVRAGYAEAMAGLSGGGIADTIDQLRRGIRRRETRAGSCVRFRGGVRLANFQCQSDGGSG